MTSLKLAGRCRKCVRQALCWVVACWTPLAALTPAACLPCRLQVQCWRNPPCARATFATTDECAKRKSLADWHTLLGPDPHFPNGVSQYREFGDMLVQELVNQTVVVVGDSISSLIFQAALCEAAKSSSVVDAMDPRVAAAGVGAVERFRKGMHGITQQARSSGNGASPWVGGGPHALTVVLETGTLFVRKGWHRWGRGDMEAVLSLADVVLVNYGLHYVGNLTEFEEDAPQMLAQLDAWAAGRPGRRVLWRETAEEHTNVETHQPGSGYLDTEVGHPDGNKTTGCQCAAERPPDRPSQPAVLNAIIGKLLPQFPHIAFVPFYNLTKPRYNMHEAAFCSFEGLSQSPGHPSFCWCVPPLCCTASLKIPMLTHSSHLAPSDQTQRLRPFLLHPGTVARILQRHVRRPAKRQVKPARRFAGAKDNDSSRVTTDVIARMNARLSVRATSRCGHQPSFRQTALVAAHHE